MICRSFYLWCKIRPKTHEVVPGNKEYKSELASENHFIYTTIIPWVFITTVNKNHPDGCQGMRATRLVFVDNILSNLLQRIIKSYNKFPKGSSSTVRTCIPSALSLEIYIPKK